MTGICVTTKDSLQNETKFQDDLTRNLTRVNLSSADYAVHSGHVDIPYEDLTKKNLRLMCNVSYKGPVLYSWTKDGVHLPNHSPVSYVNCFMILQTLRQNAFYKVRRYRDELLVS